MWVTFIIDYYMNALCPFFLSYWIHLLLYMFTWMEFPRIRSFSSIIYGLHGINEKTLPRINHFTTYTYFSFIVFPHVLYAILLQQNEFYMLPFIYYTMKSPSLWYVRIYEEMRYFCAVLFCCNIFCLPKCNTSYHTSYSLKFYIVIQLQYGWNHNFYHGIVSFNIIFINVE